MFSLLSVCLSVSLLATVSSQKSCQLKEVDLCLTQTALSLRARPLVPKDHNQWNALCEETQKLVTCLEDYSKRCVSKLQSEALRWLSAPLDPRARCEDDQLKTRAFHHSTCLNALPLGECLDRITRDLCCSVRAAQHCVAEKSAQCGQEAQQLLRDLLPVDTMATALCGQPETSCNATIIGPALARTLATVIGRDLK